MSVSPISLSLFFIFSLCFCLLSFCISCVDNMLLLTGVERKKYLAALEAKEVKGCVASDPTGVVKRKVRRKDVGMKIDAAPSETVVETEAIEVLGVQANDSHAGAPSPKKMKMIKGDDVGRTRSSALKGAKDA